MVNITDAAAARIRALRAIAVAPPAGLRIAVVGGGCNGYSYDITWAPEVKQGDKVFEKDGSKVIVDFKSYIFLKDATLDYVETLAASGFKILNPAVKSQCGCGESFSV